LTNARQAPEGHIYVSFGSNSFGGSESVILHALCGYRWLAQIFECEHANDYVIIFIKLRPSLGRGKDEKRTHGQTDRCIRRQPGYLLMPWCIIYVRGIKMYRFKVHKEIK